MSDRPARTLTAGVGNGEALTLREPLSFWGGFDAATGRIVDTHHPQRGARLSGRVVFMCWGRGSSSSASVVAEAIRLGTAPAAIVLDETDPVIALGAVIAAELYAIELPVVVAPSDPAEAVEDGTIVTVDASIERGWIRIRAG